MSERLATRWVPGSGPVDVQPLGAGLVNDSYRVVRGSKLYSMRVAVADAQALGLDRDWECKVLQQAAAAGLAPTIRCCNPGEGILISDWAQGRAWTAGEVRQPAHIDTMARLLRRVHALEIPRPTRAMDPGAWIAHYDAVLEGAPNTRDLRGNLQSAAVACLAKSAESPTRQPVLCHSDLHRLNVVIGAVGLTLLDWEYAHVSDAYWDLAGWAANGDLSADEVDRLLASYLERAPREEEQIRLRRWLWLFDYVALSWSSLYVAARPGPGSREVSARAELLSSRLARSATNACR